MDPASPESLELSTICYKSGIMGPATGVCPRGARSSTTLYLPVEIWRMIFYQVIDENEEVARIHQLDMAQLGPVPFERFHPGISNLVKTRNLALVCRLWRDLSEEVRYRHLYVSDTDSIQRLTDLVTKTVFDRTEAPSFFDSTRRTRGSWTYSLTVTASAIPSSLNSAYGYRMTRALISLLNWLPNIRQFVSSFAFAPSKHLLSRLPLSIIHLSFGPGGSNSLRLLPRQVHTRISMLEITALGDMQGNPMQLTNLVYLSIYPRTCVVTDWDVPKLSFLSLKLSTGDETALSDTFMEKLGTNLRRLELQNVGIHQIGISDGFLRWCPALETLLFDFFGFTFLGDATPRGSRSFPSIRTVVLVIKDCGHFQQAVYRPSFIELQDHVNKISDLIARSLPNLAHIFVSFSRMTLLIGADIYIREEMKRMFNACIGVPFSVVFF